MNGRPGALTGLFLGAGASCELGMPLVWEMTDELRTVLTRDKLLRFGAAWRQQRASPQIPDTMLEELAHVAARSDVHYESVLGYLETQFRRLGQPADVQQKYHALYSWLISLVYHVFLRHHVSNVEFIRQNARFFSGLTHLASQSAPLWVFSLNHDLIIECLAAEHGVPIHSGFSSEVITLPRRDARGSKIGDLKAAVLSAEDLEKSNLAFAQHGVAGINLLKVHGALDVFAFRNGHDFLKLVPEELSVARLIDTLRAANEELIYVHPQTLRRADATNEIAYQDDNGEMQFLRRSLLAGAYKFDDRRSQVLSRRFLELFRSNINWVNNLVCIGYSFGDVHINNVIRAWLEMSAERNIEIVDPFIEKVPGFLLHVAPQVTVVKSRATDYLDGVAGIVRDRHDALLKRLGRWYRSQKDGQGGTKFLTFAKRCLESGVPRFVEALVALRTANGDLDLKGLGLTPDQCASRLSKDVGLDLDDILEKFLSEHESATASPVAT